MVSASSSLSPSSSYVSSKRKPESQSPGSSPSVSMIPKTIQADKARYRKMRLAMEAWNPGYQTTTGLDERSWQEIGKYVAQNENDWKKLEKGTGIRIPKETSTLARTLVVFKTSEEKLFPVVLLKTKKGKIPAVGKGSEKTVKLALDWLRGCFLAEYTLPTDNLEDIPSFLTKILGCKGIMSPEIFRFKFTKETEKTDKVAKTIVLNELFNEDFQTLFFPSKNNDINNQLKKVAAQIKMLGPKEPFKDDYSILPDLVTIKMTQHPLAVAEKLQRFLKKMSSKESLSPEAKALNENLKELAALLEAEAGKITISLAEKITIIIDMLEALKALNKEKIQHDDLIQGNVLIERDAAGKILHAKLNDFESAHLNEEAFAEDQDPNASTVGEMLSRLFYKKFGASPLKIHSGDESSSDEAEGIYSDKKPPKDSEGLPELVIWDLLHDNITTPSEMDDSIAKLDKLRQQLLKDDEKKE